LRDLSGDTCGERALRRGESTEVRDGRRRAQIEAPAMHRRRGERAALDHGAGKWRLLERDDELDVSADRGRARAGGGPARAREEREGEKDEAAQRLRQRSLVPALPLEKIVSSRECGRARAARRRR